VTEKNERLDRIEAILESLAQRDEVFDKRIAALLARTEALTARHEALSESVEMMAQSWFRNRGKEPGEKQ
jgi:hypothetical protein